MAAASPAPDHLEPLAGRYALRAFLVAADLLQQERRPDTERGGQGHQRF
jgi:hypothetical protein